MCAYTLLFSLPRVLDKYELIYHVYAPTKCKVTPFISALIGAYPEKEGLVKKWLSLITHYGESRIVAEIANHLI